MPQLLERKASCLISSTNCIQREQTGSDGRAPLAQSLSRNQVAQNGFTVSSRQPRFGCYLPAIDYRICGCHRVLRRTGMPLWRNNFCD